MHGSAAESDSEKAYNDELKRWMEQHQDDIENLAAFAHQFQFSRDGNRRKAGNVFHASLVRRFYEYGTPLKVVGVEYKNIEPNTDVDIKLNDEIYIQVWHGKMPVGYAIDKQIQFGDRSPLHADWDKEYVWAEKKIRQLPSNTGKGFVLNIQPGYSFPSPLIHDHCSPNKCVMILSREALHTILYGTKDFKYLDEACEISHALGRPLRHVLGDWHDLSKHGRDPLHDASYGLSSSNPIHFTLFQMYHHRMDLLSYARDVLKYPYCDKLENLDYESLFLRLATFYSYQDDACQDDGSRVFTPIRTSTWPGGRDEYLWKYL